MKRVIRFILAIVVLVGGVALWEYSGAASAITAQNEVRENGFYYNGETWKSPESFQELKQLLAKRDPSLHTSSDLMILPETRGSDLRIKYSFFSVEIYEGLSRTRDFPPAIKTGFAVIPTVGPVLFFLVLIGLAVAVSPWGMKSKKEKPAE